MAGKEAELHQAAGDVVGEIQAIEDGSFSLRELCECTHKCGIWHSADPLLTLICSIDQYPPPGVARQGSSHSIPDSFSRQYHGRQEYFNITYIDNTTLIFYTDDVVRYQEAKRYVNCEIFPISWIQRAFRAV